MESSSGLQRKRSFDATEESKPNAKYARVAQDPDPEKTVEKGVDELAQSNFKVLSEISSTSQNSSSEWNVWPGPLTPVDDAFSNEMEHPEETVGFPNEIWRQIMSLMTKSEDFLAMKSLNSGFESLSQDFKVQRYLSIVFQLLESMGKMNTFHRVLYDLTRYYLQDKGHSLCQTMLGHLPLESFYSTRQAQNLLNTVFISTFLRPVIMHNLNAENYDLALELTKNFCHNEFDLTVGKILYGKAIKEARGNKFDQVQQTVVDFEERAETDPEFSREALIIDLLNCEVKRLRGKDDRLKNEVLKCAEIEEKDLFERLKDFRNEYLNYSEGIEGSQFRSEGMKKIKFVEALAYYAKDEMMNGNINRANEILKYAHQLSLEKVMDSDDVARGVDIEDEGVDSLNLFSVHCLCAVARVLHGLSIENKKDFSEESKTARIWLLQADELREDAEDDFIFAISKFQMGYIDEAQKVLDKEIMPLEVSYKTDNKEFTLSIRILMAHLVKLGEIDKAKKYLNEIISEILKNADKGISKVIDLGQFMVSHGWIEELKEVIKTYEDSIVNPLRRLLIQYYLRKGELEKAMTEFQSITFKGDADYYAMLVDIAKVRLEKEGRETAVRELFLTNIPLNSIRVAAILALILPENEGFALIRFAFECEKKAAQKKQVLATQQQAQILQAREN